MDEQTADYESARDADRIQMNEEIERANDVAQVCEERVKEMEDLEVKMKGEYEEEKKRAVNEAVKRMKDEHQLLMQVQQQQQEQGHRKEQKQEQQVERTQELSNEKELHIFDGMPPQHKAPEMDKHVIKCTRSSISISCDDDAEEEEHDAKVLATPERIIQIMRDQSEWMFHVSEEAEMSATSSVVLTPNACCDGKRKTCSSSSFKLGNNNDDNGYEDDDDEEDDCSSQTTPSTSQYQPKKLELKQVLEETTSKLQQLLYPLSTPHCLTCSAPAQQSSKPKIQTLLDTVSSAVLSVAAQEKHDALKKARRQHFNALGVAIDSRVKKSKEEMDATMRQMEASHNLELTAVRWNAQVAIHGLAAEQRQRKNEQRVNAERGTMDRRKKKPRERRDSPSIGSRASSESRDGDNKSHKSPSSYSSSTSRGQEQSGKSSSFYTSATTQPASSSIITARSATVPTLVQGTTPTKSKQKMTKPSPILDKKEGTLLSRKRSMYWAEMEAALRSATVTALREKEDALRNVQAEHIAVLETVMTRATAAEARNKKLSRQQISIDTTARRRRTVVLKSPPSDAKSVLDESGAKWVKKEDYAFQVREALRRAVDISTKQDVNMERHREGVLKHSPRYSFGGANYHQNIWYNNIINVKKDLYNEKGPEKKGLGERRRRR